MDTGGTISSTLKAIKAKRSKKPTRSGKIIGSRIQVYRGNATHTSGRLTKNDLIRNQHGRIVSKKRHEQGKTAIKYLEKGGYKGILPSKRAKKTLTGGCSVIQAEMPDKFRTSRMDGSGTVDPDTILDK
jgi:hypothetical protein